LLELAESGVLFNFICVAWNLVINRGSLQIGNLGEGPMTHTR
jgi:hypothetical protein